MSGLDQLPRFKPEFAWLYEAWVEALESGEYRQARKTLRDKTGAMCCLGVLKRVAYDNGVRLPNTRWDNGLIGPRDVGRLMVVDDAAVAGEWADELLEPLAVRNDKGRQSFKQIARIIRKRMAPEVAS